MAPAGVAQAGSCRVFGCSSITRSAACYVHLELEWCGVGAATYYPQLTYQPTNQPTNQPTV